MRRFRRLTPGTEDAYLLYLEEQAERGRARLEREEWERSREPIPADGEIHDCDLPPGDPMWEG